MIKSRIKILSEQRAFIFLVMCLCVHIFNVGLFWKIEIFPLAVLNVISALLYVAFLTLFKKNETLQISFAYFEIIAFSALSELISGGLFGYLNFVIGMVAVIFFLLPANDKRKFVYQSVGALLAIVISQESAFNFSINPELMVKVLEYKSFVNSLNVIITLFTLFYVSNLYLVEQRTTREKLDYTSNHDMLTGLYNRRFFEGIMKRSKDEMEHPYSVAMLDVDNFKKINDTYGHEFGDKVLTIVSQCIESCLPQDAVAVRWGGEEFVLYLPQKDNENALKILNDLRTKLIEFPIRYHETEISITATIGLCTGNNIADYESYLREADEKLYWGKTHGKNQIVNKMG